MKKRISFLLCIILVVMSFPLFTACDDDVISFEEWVISDGAFDYNGDRKINQEDYDIAMAYLSWKKSDNSFDYNGDRVIDYEDYKLLTDFNVWKESELVEDFNGDGQITYDDYEYVLGFSSWENKVDYNQDETIDLKDYVILKRFEKWENKVDLDENGKIDAYDYVIYDIFEKWEDKVDFDLNGVVDFQDYKIYVLWEDKEDVDGDGSIDGNDFELLKKFQDISGTYVFSTFACSSSGLELKLLKSGYSLEDLKEDSRFVNIKITRKGEVQVLYLESVGIKLKEDKANVDEAISKVKLEKLSDTCYRIETELDTGSETVNLCFDLTKDVNGKLSSYSQYTYCQRGKYQFYHHFYISFTLEKVNA